MENMKLPIALVVAMIAQISAGVWWVSQQAATITSLEATVAEMSSKMAIEENVNLRRDVDEHHNDIEELWEETEYLWEMEQSLNMILQQQIEIKGRISVLENELKYIDRDHNTMLDSKGGMNK
jgi:cell division protein FtsB